MARLRVSIVLESGARIGPGKAKLLESIRDTGSISAAAREMGMSCRALGSAALHNKSYAHCG
jgi:molybdenum-dependent DNA-binding transcriptional regulator ModE